MQVHDKKNIWPRNNQFPDGSVGVFGSEEDPAIGFYFPVDGQYFYWWFNDIEVSGISEGRTVNQLVHFGLCGQAISFYGPSPVEGLKYFKTRCNNLIESMNDLGDKALTALDLSGLTPAMTADKRYHIFAASVMLKKEEQTVPPSLIPMDIAVLPQYRGNKLIDVAFDFLVMVSSYDIVVDKKLMIGI